MRDQTYEDKIREAAKRYAKAVAVQTESQKYLDAAKGSLVQAEAEVKRCEKELCGFVGPNIWRRVIAVDGKAVIVQYDEIMPICRLEELL